MTETGSDDAFQDLIAQPWPSEKEGARPWPAPRAFPDFSSRRAPDALEIARCMNDVLLVLSAKLAENDAPRDA